MSSIRLALLLVIAGALTLFVLQNSTIVLPLVILGVPTQAIPLAFWMMGAIAAGALTTTIIAALFRITAFTAAPRQSKRRDRSPDPSRIPPDRGLDPRDRPYGVSDSPRTRIQSDDDWEPQPREVWDDWEASAAVPNSREDRRDRSADDRSGEDRPVVDFQMRDRQPDRVVERIEYRFTDDRSEDQQDDRRDEEPEFYRDPDPAPNFGNVEPPVYDADYKVYSPPYRSLDEPYESPYTEPEYREPEYREPEYREPDYSEPEYPNEYPQPPYTEPEPEVWDDWEEEPETPIAPPEPQRPIVEVQQTPKSQYRSGTVYSYSYRGDDEPKVDRVVPEANRPTEEAASESKERVIIPPAPAAAEDEDWGFEDDSDPKARRSSDDDW